jgi:hypothetical protein
VTLATPTTGYVLDGYGGIHPFAPAGTDLPAQPSSSGYSPGNDIVKGIAFDPETGSGAEVKAYMSDGAGGTVYPFTEQRTKAHTAVALIPGGGGAGYSLDGYGGLHPFGGAPAITSSSGSWPGWDIARAIALAPNSTTSAVTGYVLDGFGGLHPFAAGSGTAPSGKTDAPYWPNWDIARGLVLSTPTSGYVLDGFGGIHPFAAAGTSDPPSVTPADKAYWPNWDIARGIVLSTPSSGYTLDGFGGLHPFAGGGAAMPPAPDGRAAYWSNWDIARSVTLATPTTGYVLDGYGGIHPFAPAGTDLPSVSGSTPYWRGWDVFDAIGYDRSTGTGVMADAAYLDGSGGIVSTFTGPVTPAADSTATPSPDGNSSSGSTGTRSGGTAVGLPIAARCVVPRLKHLTLRQARRALQHAHCRVGSVRQRPHRRNHRAARVVSQSPRPHKQRPADYPINITLK